MSSVARPIPFLEGDDRMTAFPIVRQDIWNLYQKAQDSYWVPKEISMSNDRADFKKLSPGRTAFCQTCSRVLCGI
jgi:ribonucleotide reductase beta subunit family protein with ferritin-like domain